MRIVISVAMAALATSTMAPAPAEAQPGGTYMWCMAWADNGAEKTYYYSGFFAAGAWEKDRKALAFKSEAEDAEMSAAKVTATCFDPVEYDKAVAMRNAAMKAGPGTVLDWEG